MSHEIEVECRFVVPDDMDRSNIEHVVGQFFADIERTDRFKVAEIIDKAGMDDDSKDRLVTMLSSIDDENIDQLEVFIDVHTEEDG